MPDFKPATEAEQRTLRALLAAQRQVRRVDLRIAIKQSHVRLARTLKAARPMTRVSDLLWHAQITAREAHSLGTLARAVRSRRVLAKALDKLMLRAMPGAKP